MVAAGVSMEPVPETERMDKFRSAPLRLHTLTTTFPSESSSNTVATTTATAEQATASGNQKDCDDCDSGGDTSPSSTISLASTTSVSSVTPTAAPTRRSQRQLQPQVQSTDLDTRNASNSTDTDTISDLPQKPPTVRRSTDPSIGSPQSCSSFWSGSVHSPLSPSMSSPSLSLSSSIPPYRPRTTSPLSLSQSTFSTHARSRSHASTLALPTGRTISGIGRPASPAMPARPTSRARKALVEVFPTSPVRQSVFDQPERRVVSGERSESPLFGAAVSSRYPRHPGHSSMPSLTNIPSTPTSLGSLPWSRGADSFPLSSSNGSFGGLYLSSMPTTPTSARSRSPSISSLETIPDSPGAEEEALEAERIAQLKADAEAAERCNEPTDPKSARKSLEVPPRGRVVGSFGGSRDKRKRWSVCGAERRGDLNLGTIWED